MTSRADLVAVQLVDPIHDEGHAGHVVAEEAVDALAQDLRQRADATRDDRGAAGQRFDGDEAERLRP